MERLEDRHIKDVWRHHFSTRANSRAARLVLVDLIGIIKERSGASNPIETTAAALRFGIPAEEWKQFGMER